MADTISKEDIVKAYNILKETDDKRFNTKKKLENVNRAKRHWITLNKIRRRTHQNEEDN